MRTTFLNDNADGNLKEVGLAHLNSVIDDLRTYMTDFDVWDEGNDDLPRFCEYGLDFGFVELGTFDDQEEAYYRFQLSWDGPSDEIRFYRDGRIEYVFLDWFVGVGFDVTDVEEFSWLAENFQESMMFDWERDEADHAYENL